MTLPASHFSNGSEWADAPEHIRGMLEAFFAELGGNPSLMSKEARKGHINAAHEFYATIGERPDLVVPAIKRNIEKGITTASLRSLMASARELKYTMRPKEQTKEAPMVRDETKADGALKLASILEQRGGPTNLSERELLYSMVAQFGYDVLSAHLESHKDVTTCGRLYNDMVLRPIARRKQ